MLSADGATDGVSERVLESYPVGVPVTLTGARSLSLIAASSTGLIAFLLLGFAAYGVAFWLEGRGPRNIGVVIVLFGSLGLWVAWVSLRQVRLFRAGGPKLRLDAEGLTIEQPGRLRHARWADIEWFRVVAAAEETSIVKFDFREVKPRRDLLRIANSVGGVGYGGMRNDELAHYLEAWRGWACD